MDHDVPHLQMVPLPVDDPVVEQPVGEEHPRHDEEGHQGEIHAAEAEGAGEIGAEADDGLAEGEHHEEHHPFRQVLGIDGHQGVHPLGEHRHDKAEDQGNPGKGPARDIEKGDGHQHDGRLDQQHPATVFQMPGRPGRRRVHMPQLTEILHRQIQQDQGPGRVVLGIHAHIRAPDPFRQVVQQIHVDEQPDVVRRGIGAVAVDVQGTEVPDLQDHQGGIQEGDVGLEGEEPSLHVKQQLVAVSQKIDEDEVIDQLDVLDLLLPFFSEQFPHDVSPPSRCVRASALPPSDIPIPAPAAGTVPVPPGCIPPRAGWYCTVSG